MDKTLEFFFAHAEAQFDGESFDGPSFMKTLDRLSAEDAAFQGTWEGYSAWSVALHVAYFKHFILRSAVGDEAAGAYPFPKAKYGFARPERVDEASWAEFRAGLRALHARTMEAIRGFPAERWGDLVPKWEVPYGSAIAWLFGHDAYHAAQIRNMGVPGLKEAREGD